MDAVPKEIIARIEKAFDASHWSVDDYQHVIARVRRVIVSHGVASSSVHCVEDLARSCTSAHARAAAQLASECCGCAFDPRTIKRGLIRAYFLGHSALAPHLARVCYRAVCQAATYYAQSARLKGREEPFSALACEWIASLRAVITVLEPAPNVVAAVVDARTQRARVEVERARAKRLGGASLDACAAFLAQVTRANLERFKP